MRDPLSLIGVPYVLESSDPAVGLDCWTLVEYVRRECFARRTCAVPPRSHSTVNAAHAIAHARRRFEWQRIAIPGFPGSVVGMSISARLPLHHVGIALEGGVLHAWAGPSSGGVGSVVLTPWPRLAQSFKQIEVYECLD
jgi:cell wall-associated NlpC family hydrolase